MQIMHRIFYIFVKIYYVLTKFQCKIVLLRFLNKQRRVAKTEKSVFHINRGFVHIHHVFVARKSAHVHDKRAFRQMEIRYHSFQNFEFVAGINENLRFAVSGVDETVFVGNRLRTRPEVVPTAITRRPSFTALFMIFSFSSDNS